MAWLQLDYRDDDGVGTIHVVPGEPAEDGVLTVYAGHDPTPGCRCHPRIEHHGLADLVIHNELN